MILHFPESNDGSRAVLTYKVFKKWFCYYYIVVELEFDVLFYLYKSKSYGNKRRVVLKARGLTGFCKFYEMSSCEVYVISEEDNSILDIGILTQQTHKKMRKIRLH